MILNFNKVILHNFLSYGHAEIDLNDKHYCLVSGVNNCSKDNATSNGAGKSTWGSAICWALTGETIQGLTSNIKNINVPENSCYVELDFIADKKHYVITRYKNPKSDLKIILDGKDISGKGIRESEAVLNEYLPDLTSQLIASIIILGQGLPDKFTNNSPSERKEVLEKLTKSDFMIQDLKDRITNRSGILSKELRGFEDAILSDNSQCTLLKSQIEEQKKIIESFSVKPDFDKNIKELNEQIAQLEKVLSEHSQIISEQEKLDSEQGSILNEKLSAKTKVLDADNKTFDAFKLQYFEDKSKLTSEINTKNAKIKELKSITDVCPTCGQKLPNVIKPDTSGLEKEVSELNANYSELEKNYQAALTQHNTYVKQVEDDYQKDISETNYKIKQIKDKLNIYRQDSQLKERQLIQLRSDLNKQELEKQNFNDNLTKAQNKLKEQQDSVKKLEDKILYNNSMKEDVSKHISVVNQMNTLVKRDFRGYLLINVINYINKKAKEYALDIFENDSLEFSLNKNNIDISYCGKDFENLSGGEKQRVDLIIQFAIRDMMKQYLGFSSNILILDEIFDQLDTIGCTNVLNLISNKLNDIESIFIISHRADELEIPYDSELVIVKNEEGVSSAIWE